MEKGSFGLGQEDNPVKDVTDRELNEGNFANGPVQNDSGSFAKGQEETPVADAKERKTPGTFADEE